jgi:type 1 glutamine amidotransferase
MFYTTGELPMSGDQKTALLNFVRSGRGFLGVHSATDTFYTWPDYLDLVGGYFNGHPWHQAVTIASVAFWGAPSARPSAADPATENDLARVSAHGVITATFYAARNATRI